MAAEAQASAPADALADAVAGVAAGWPPSGGGEGGEGAQLGIGDAVTEVACRMSPGRAEVVAVKVKLKVTVSSARARLVLGDFARASTKRATAASRHHPYDVAIPSGAEGYPEPAVGREPH